MMEIRFQVLIYLVVILNSFNCDTTNTESGEPKCCDNTTNQRVFVEFSSNVVQHEYIVQFKNYYQTEARAKYIKAALESSEVICYHRSL
jgi:hypothetical protein